jgi:rubrerythrin
MSKLKGTRTEQNLKDAFAGESANRCHRISYKADVEGYNDVSAVFRSTEGETGHAHGHLEYLEGKTRPPTADRRHR